MCGTRVDVRKWVAHWKSYHDIRRKVLMQELNEGDSPTNPHWCEPPIPKWFRHGDPSVDVPEPGDRGQDEKYQQMWIDCLKKKTPARWWAHQMMWTTFKSKGVDPFKEWPLPISKQYKERD
jgi:hypothetical protein